LFINPGSGTSVTFPITIAQGGTSATSVIGAWISLRCPLPRTTGLHKHQRQI
jgi:hypothetical protein